MKKQVVILTLSHKEVLEPYEVISLQQCHKILGKYDTWFVCPRGLDVSGYEQQLGFTPNFHFIASKWLSTYEQSNRLKILPYLYSNFSNYEYILFHEPDVFVFKDELTAWCEQGYDYIGAPWLEGVSLARNNTKYIGVGNSGLSLKKTDSFIRVTKSYRRLKSTKQYWLDYNKMNWKGKTAHFPSQLFGYLFKNNFHYCFNDYYANEDVFWSNYAPEKFSWFKVAPVSEALKFSMEVQPKRMFYDNNQELPFGCHAWWKYDLAFWKPFIEQFGYNLST